MKKHRSVAGAKKMDAEGVLTWEFPRTRRECRRPSREERAVITPVWANTAEPRLLPVGRELPACKTTFRASVRKSPLFSFEG